MTAAKPVKLSWEENGVTKTDTFDFLVVACDPRAIRMTGRTANEKEVMGKLTSNIFSTSLFEVERERGAPFASRFCPANLKNPDNAEAESHMFIFRDEARAHCRDWPESKKNEAPGNSGNKTLITCYQYHYGSLLNGDPDDITRRLNDTFHKDLYKESPEKLEWVDFKVATTTAADNKVQLHRKQQLVEDYFPHFEYKDLDNGIIWKVLEAQGESNTAYVASFTCFESVLHCYLYGKMVMDRLEKSHPVFTTQYANKADIKVAVVGGGPSGILFATQQLIGRGYTNVKLLEARGNLGGKTRTVYAVPPTNQSMLLPCELGTCYLSTDYQPLRELMLKYQAGTPFNLEGEKYSPPYRGVIDPDMIPYAGEYKSKIEGIIFPLWCLMVAAVHDENLDGVLLVGPDGLTDNERIAKENSTWGAVKAKFKKWWRDFKTFEFTPRGELAAYVEFWVLVRVWWSMRSYADIHEKLMGNLKGYPIPEKQIKETKYFKYEWTIHEFLENNGLLNLRGLFTYGYSVQGYCDLEHVSAYYALVWLTPSLLWACAYSTIWQHLPKRAKWLFSGITAIDPDQKLYGVYAMERGWQEFWDRIACEDELFTTAGRTVLNAKNVTVTARPGVAATTVDAELFAKQAEFQEFITNASAPSATVGGSGAKVGGLN